MHILRYDVNGNGRHLSCLKSVLLTDIATALYVTNTFYTETVKKSLAFVLTWLDPMMSWSKRHRVFKDMQKRTYNYCRIIGNAALDWLKYLRKSQYLSRSSSAVLAEKSCGRGKLDMAVVRY